MIIIEQDLINITEQPTVINITETGAILGNGDMTKAVYDPNDVDGDAFDMENMFEGATSKIFTATERAKLEADIKLQQINAGATGLDPTPGLINASNITNGNQYNILTDGTLISVGGVTLATAANNESIQQSLVFNGVFGTLFAVGAFPTGRYIDTAGDYQTEPVIDAASTFVEIVAISRRSSLGVLTITYYMDQGVKP